MGLPRCHFFCKFCLDLDCLRLYDVSNLVDEHELPEIEAFDCGLSRRNLDRRSVHEEFQRMVLVLHWSTPSDLKDVPFSRLLSCCYQSISGVEIWLWSNFLRLNITLVSEQSCPLC